MRRLSELSAVQLVAEAKRLHQAARSSDERLGRMLDELMDRVRDADERLDEA